MTVIHGIIVDCEKPRQLGEFWSQVLGYEYRRESDDWVSLRNPQGGPHLSFDKVPEGKVVKNRVHLDIRPTGGRTREEEKERLETMGASVFRLIDDNPLDVHYIMLDPEGNEFCVLDPAITD